MRRRWSPPLVVLAMAIVASSLPAAVATAAASDVYVVQAEIGPPGGAVSSGFSAVDLSPDGSVLVVGAPTETVDGDAGVGAAYVYRRTDVTWSLDARIGAPLGMRRFGADVALSDDGATIVIGAPRSAAGELEDAGAAAVFVSDAGTWTLEGTLAAPTGEADRRFGRSVAVSATGDTVLVTQKGDAPFAFTRTDDVWSSPTALPGPSALEVAVSADGTVALSGRGSNVSTFADGAWTSRGIVHSGWGYEGDAVALTADGSTAVITSVSDQGGAANVLEETPTSWHWIDETGGWTDTWGASAAIADDTSTIAIGQPRDGNRWQAGSVHLYRLAGEDDWTGWLMLGSPSGTPGDRFGADVAISSDGSTVAVSAPGSDAVTSEGGVVDVFVTAPSSTTTVTLEPLPTVPPGIDDLVLTARVYPIPSGGTVAFAIDGVPIPGCEAEIVGVPWGGEATCFASSAALGDHVVEATFSGHGSFSGVSGTTPMKVRPSPTVTVRTRDELIVPGTAFDVRARVEPAPTSGTMSFNLGGPIEPCQDLPVDPVSGRASCHVVPDVTGRRYVDVWFSGNDDLSVAGGAVPIVLSTFDLGFVRPRSHAQVRAGDRLDVRLELEENRFPMAEHLTTDVLESCDLEVRAFGRTWCPDRYERGTFVARIRVPASTDTGRALLEAVFRGWGRKLAIAARAVEVHVAMNQPTIAP